VRILVFKFGGSSFVDLADYRRVARYLKVRLADDADKIVVVASAMAGLTERLRGLAHGLHPAPSLEASDALLPLADALGAGLLRVAVEGAGLRATSLAGFQLGVITDDNFSRACIQRIDSGPLRRALEAANVVVIPGGQAIDAQGRPTMLGKNSSDLTAVVVAATLGLDACEIYSDVCGVYSADPNLLHGVHLIERIGYQALIDLSLSGAKVLHHGAVAEAARCGVRIICRLNRGDYRVGTIIGDGPEPRAVIVDQRSLVLDFATPEDLKRAYAHLQGAKVSVVTLGDAAERRLVVTCGFFDAVRFLAERGVQAAASDLRLVSTFEPGTPPRRDILPEARAIAMGQTLHDRLFATPPAVPVVPASVSRAAGLAEQLLPERTDITESEARRERRAAERTPGIDLPPRDELVRYLRSRGKPTVRDVLRRADGEGRLLIQPRCGVGEQEAMRSLLERLERDAQPDILTLTIDSYTRLCRFDNASHMLEVDPQGLNGYPLVSHGYLRGRELDVALQAPLQIRHGSPDPRVLFEVAIASGITAFEGGGICYNLPYCKDVPLAHSLFCWQQVDRSCGELAREGIIVDRELFGTLTAVLIPPSLSLAMTLLEALLAVREGVKCLSIAYCQSGNFAQDVAALRAIRQLAARHLPEDVEVYPVFHEWMGPFSPVRRTADATIFYGALTAHKGRATKLINKTYEEALGIPGVEANIAGIWTARAATSSLFDFVSVPEEQVEEEMAAILAEVEEIVAPVLDEADLQAAIVRAFADGRLDIPFSPSRHARSAIVPLRDASSAIRYFQSGNLSFSEATKQRNQKMLATVTSGEFDLFSKLKTDIMHFCDSTSSALVR
jgi:methylaspartate mutase epsilon subunit